MIAALFILLLVVMFWVCPVLAAYGLSVQRGRRAWFALMATVGLGWVGYVLVLVYYLSTPQRNSAPAVS